MGALWGSDLKSAQAHGGTPTVGLISTRGSACQCAARPGLLSRHKAHPGNLQSFPLRWYGQAVNVWYGQAVNVWLCYAICCHTNGSHSIPPPPPVADGEHAFHKPKQLCPETQTGLSLIECTGTTHTTACCITGDRKARSSIAAMSTHTSLRLKPSLPPYLALAVSSVQKGRHRQALHTTADCSGPQCWPEHLLQSGSNNRHSPRFCSLLKIQTSRQHPQHQKHAGAHGPK